MPAPSRTLTLDHLRQDFDARVFPTNASTRERFGMEVEVFPFRPGPNGPEDVTNETAMVAPWIAPAVDSAGQVSGWHAGAQLRVIDW